MRWQIFQQERGNIIVFLPPGSAGHNKGSAVGSVLTDNRPNVRTVGQNMYTVARKLHRMCVVGHCASHAMVEKNKVLWWRTGNQSLLQTFADIMNNGVITATIRQTVMGENYRTIRTPDAQRQQDAQQKNLQSGMRPDDIRPGFFQGAQKSTYAAPMVRQREPVGEAVYHPVACRSLCQCAVPAPILITDHLDPKLRFKRGDQMQDMPGHAGRAAVPPHEDHQRFRIRFCQDLPPPRTPMCASISDGKAPQPEVRSGA